MAKDKTYDEASEVWAEDGEVFLDGPDGVDVKVTAEAAEQTAERSRTQQLWLAGNGASRT